MHTFTATTYLQKHPSDPRRHPVRGRRPEVDVEDAHGHEDGEGDEDHGEEEVLAEEGDRQGGGGDDLGEQEEEHSQRQED